MFAAFRMLLIWLLIASMPLKALAGIGMASCGPGHHQLASSMPLDLGQAHVNLAGPLDAPAVQLHDLSHGSHGGASASAGTTDAINAVDDVATELKCSGCSPCCAAAAPPPIAGALHGYCAPDEALDARSVSSRDGVVPAVPHKPPRATGA